MTPSLLPKIYILCDGVCVLEKHAQVNICDDDALDTRDVSVFNCNNAMTKYIYIYDNSTSSCVSMRHVMLGHVTTRRHTTAHIAS